MVSSATVEPPMVTHCPDCEKCDEPDGCDYCEHEFHDDQSCDDKDCDCEGVTWEACDEEDLHVWCRRHQRGNEDEE